MTGGLPYFGGPGNNYGMHALAEAVQYARRQRGDRILVTSNGGVLSKHASGIYSALPSLVDWAKQTTTVDNSTLKPRAVSADPGRGRIVSYTVQHDASGPAHAIILGETQNGQRFVARTAAEDTQTPMAMLANDPSGKLVQVTPPDDEKLYFEFVQERE